MTRPTFLQFLLALFSLWAFSPAIAAANDLPDAPKPAAKADRGDWKFWTLVSVYAGVDLYDGITTRQAGSRGAVETSPLPRLLMGPRPSWSRMLPLGALEIAAAAKLGLIMRRSQSPVARKFWWVPQASLIASHFIYGTKNLSVCQPMGRCR